MFQKAKELEKQWAEERGMPYHDPLPEHVPPLVNKGNLIEYERYYYEWVDGWRKDTPERVAEAHGHIGVIRLKKNDWDGAEKWIRQSLELYQKISPESPQTTLGIANQYAHFGIVFALRQDFDRAKEYWLKAREVYAGADARIASRINGWIQHIDASK